MNYIAKKVNNDFELWNLTSNSKVGSISPEVKWISEGQTFKREELSMRIFYDYGKYASGTHTGWLDDPNSLVGTSIFANDDPTGIIDAIKKIEIYIQCPNCKYFH